MKNIDVVIAIDPDVERNGFARLDVATRKMELSAIPFPELIAYLRAHKHHYDSKDMTLRVVIEAGWLNRGNWHLNPRDTKAVIAASEELQRKLVERIKAKLAGASEPAAAPAQPAEAN